MDKLRRMALFARVVETGAMSAAARELGMSTSAVSQQIRQLETETGVVLLHRSTRKLTLSEAGAAFYEGCAEMVKAAQSAEQRLAQLRDAAVGELRIAAPVGFAGTHLAGALGPLLTNNPELRLRLFIEDRRIDLIEERIDLAIRIGALADSTLVARELASWSVVLCAAPAYIARRGLPKTPEDLLDHDWLVLTVLETPHQIELTGPGNENFRARLEARVASTNSRSLREMALAGTGIARQPLPDVEEEIRSGKLIQILPEWRVPAIGVYAVTPQRDAQPAKVRHAIEALRRYLSA